MPLPDFRLPPQFAALARRLPEAPAAHACAMALELARRSGRLGGDWSFLEGRRVRIALSDLGLGVTLCLRGGHFHASSVAAEVCFYAAVADYLKIALREVDPDTLFFQRRLRIEGDTELGLQLKNQLDALELPALLQKLCSR